MRTKSLFGKFCGNANLSRSADAIAILAAAFVSASAPVIAEPINGVMRDGSEWTSHNWNARELWDYHTLAKDGGEATLLAGNHGKYKLDMDVNGLTLSGLMITQLTSPLYSANGYSINMCGASPYIGRNATTDFPIELPLVGDGTNILRKTGPGLIRFETPVQSFGAFEIWAGTVRPPTNAVSAAIVSDGVPLVVRGGKVSFDSSATVGELRLGPGSGSISALNGSTATIGTLSREQGGVAVLYSTGGIDKLGDTEKILVSGRDSDASGELDGSLATLDATTAPHPLDFVTYDGTDGFKLAGAGTALVSGEDVTGIADVSEATTVSANTSVTALRIKEGAKLTLGSGTTLAVGDGTHPAGVLFQTSASTTSAGAIDGDGTLAFGDKEGVLWFSCAANGKGSAREYAFPTKISSSSGVTFASRRINSSDMIPLVTLSSGYTVGWAGSTHIAGLRLDVSAVALPGDVWIDGNAEANSAQLRVAAGTWPNRFHISGIGLTTDLSNGALYFKTDNTPTVFTGGIDLLDPAVFHANSRAVAQFKSPIFGRGGVTVSLSDVGGYMSFDATNTYSGTTKLVSANYGSLIVNQSGTLGAGPVEVESGNLLFADQNDAVVSNAITGAGGILRFRDSTASVSGDVDIGTLRLGNWTNTTAIAVRNLAASEITAERTCKITAMDADSVLTIGTNGANSAISCKLEDGSGVLSLVKRGTNVVDILGRKSYTGSTTIKAGTLRLQNNITNSADIAWWVDASDESTVTTNGEGRVTNVASKNGNGVSFVQYVNWDGSAFGLPYYDATVNGLKALRYTCADIVTKEDGTRADGSWLRGNKRVQQRTVIIVHKPRLTGLSGNTGIFGAFGRDMGARVNKNGWNGAWADENGSSYCTTGGFRQNGVKNDMKYYDDQVSVTVMRQGTERLSGQYSSNSDFNPALGGYATWGDKSNGYLGFNGDICEAIAFNRYLPDDEVKLIENYLSEKWRGSTINADAPTMEALVEQSDLLPTTTDLEIYPDATFDLNGVSQTVKTLSGQGRIINSSATPATLTVTGGITFRGVVGAGVTLLKGDGSAADLDLRVEEGATLGVTNGTASVSPYVELPVTNNIGFWCDASYRPDETILRDEDGGVTNWICRAGTVSDFYFNTNNEYCDIKPTYSASSHGGRGGVAFSSGRCALFPRATCHLRTVFLVTKLGTSGQYIFGRDHYDLSFRAATGWFNLHGKFNINPVGALAHINGVDYTDAAISALYPPEMPNPLLVTACAEDWQCDLGNYNTSWMLGCNMNNNGNNQEMAEIIVYTNRLSDAEIARVEDYLMKKWGLKDGSVAAYDTAFADGSSIDAEGTGVVDAQGAAVTLSTLTGAGGSVTNFSHLTVTDSITLDVINGIINPLTIFGDVTFGTSANGYDIPVYIDDWRTLDTSVASQRAVTVLSADGETEPVVMGALHAGEQMRGWSLSRDGFKWSIVRGGLILIVR